MNIILIMCLSVTSFKLYIDLVLRIHKFTKYILYVGYLKMQQQAQS